MAQLIRPTANHDGHEDHDDREDNSKMCFAISESFAAIAGDSVTASRFR
jgi:hypothetical protein